MQIRKRFLVYIILGLALVLIISFGLKNMLVRPLTVKPVPAAKALVAIVIDDWGYNLQLIKLLEQIDAPVTVSILPNLRYSAQIAKLAKGQGREVIIHLPLEPQMQEKKIGWEKGTITTAMSNKEVIEKLHSCLASVSCARGVSNHMGSRATQDERLMSVIFKELKKEDLFFLDSFVTDKSICAALAKKIGIRFILRNIFIDNFSDYEYIQGQLEKLGDYALENGQAVGIGHARISTLKALKQIIPQMQAKGIKLVFLSSLVK